MSVHNPIIMLGFGKLPKDCAQVLFDRGKPIREIWQTEESLFSPLEGFCKKSNIVFRKPDRQKKIMLLRDIREPTTILSINNNFIFPDEITENGNIRIINFHNSLLPLYPGNGKVIPSWAIFNGESRLGVTWHLINNKIDAGNILFQEEFEISENDTAMSVTMRAIDLGFKLFQQKLEEILDTSFMGSPQLTGDRRIYRLKDIPNNGFFSMEWDYIQSSCFLRGMDCRPFKYLPAPKIIIEDMLYLIKEYMLDKDFSKSRDNKAYRINELIGNNLTLYYKMGKIELQLIRKKHAIKER